MKDRLLLLILAVLLAGLAPVAQAQTGANPPPTIIHFAIDLPAITLADAEAGATSAILSWRTVGMMGDVRLRLETFQLNAWVPLANETGQPLDPTGRLPIIVQHPLNFGPPTYRLSILDAQDHVLDERIVLVPYDLEASEEPAVITSFTTGTTGIEVNALARGEVRIPVAWQVANRPPTANLLFEQVMPDGATVSVELPRAALWVASMGQGTVAPVLPNGDRTVRLRLRLVDLESGETLASQEIALPISGTLATPTTIPSATPTALPPTPVVFVPTAPPPPPSAPVITSFTASPDLVDRGGMVTVSWRVTGASDITVWLLDPVGRLSESRTAQPATGAWTVTLHSGYVDSAVFYLIAVGPGGAQAQATVTVLIRCPYTYFFGATPTGEGCPLAGPTDVPGAYQPFQGGFMLWRGDMRYILVLANGGQVYRYPDTWTEGEPIPTVEAPPPPGLEAPARGFGKVWALNPSVRQVLGWPTGGEQSYTLRTQQSGAPRYARTYMTLPDGRVIYVVENSWQFLP